MPKAYVLTRSGVPGAGAPVGLDRPRPGPGRVSPAVRAPGRDPAGQQHRTGCRRPGEADGAAFPAGSDGEAVRAIGGTDAATAFPLPDEARAPRVTTCRTRAAIGAAA